MTCRTGTDLAQVLDAKDQAEHPVDASLAITSRYLAWSANPIVSLRPLASDLNTVRRGRVSIL